MNMKLFPKQFDIYGYYDNNQCNYGCLDIYNNTDKTACLENMNPHYTNPLFDKGQTHTVFGKESKELHYVYNDRIQGSVWDYCWNRATNEGMEEVTASKIEKALSYFYDDDTLDIQHIQVGVNRATGFSYHVYGFTAKKPDSQRAYVRYEKTKNSPEFKKILRAHGEAFNQSRKYHRLTSQKLQTLKDIDRKKKEIDELEQSLPDLEKRVAEAHLAGEKAQSVFNQLKESTKLDMPYHEKISFL
jgi:hypothetical protein